jgi:hypothetical protein
MGYRRGSDRLSSIQLINPLFERNFPTKIDQRADDENFER